VFPLPGLTIEADPVNSINNSRVATVHPIVPGINVADSGEGSSSSGNHRASALDVIDENIRALSQSTLVQDALDRNPVEVLRANRNTNDKIGKGSTILLDGGPESVQLILKDIAACRRPQP